MTIETGAGTPAAAATAPRAGHAGPFIETRDGTRLAYRDWGGGPPIVFLAGWALSSDAWAYQMIDLIGRGFRCVAYDRRGHGNSADPGGGYDYDTLAGDLADVMAALDLRDAALVGHSMACGEIARYLSRRGADRVKRVVFVAPGTPFLARTESNPAGIDPGMFDALRAAILADYPKWLGDNAPPFFTPEISAQTIAWFQGLMLRTSMQAVIECNRSFTQTDFRSDLPRMTVPTLVIQGDKDMSMPLPLTGQATVPLLPDGELIVYEGAPHGLPITHRERLTADLLAALAHDPVSGGPAFQCVAGVVAPAAS